MALEILRKTFKKEYNRLISHLQEHFFEQLNVVTETIFFSEKFEPFREKMAKMMNYIDLDTPSDNLCGTFKHFRAVTLQKPVCRSDRLIVGFNQDGEY